MEFDRYEILMQIIQSGSLTKTAQKTGYTQSGISHILSSIEEELGVAVLLRSRSGISLTPEGEELLPHIQSLTQSRSNLRECVNHLHDLDSGIIRIGTLQSISTQILPEAIARFRRTYPGVRFELIAGHQFANIQSVVNGTTDFGFTCLHDESMYTELQHCRLKSFITEKMLVIMHADHPLKDLQFFPVEALQNEKYILIVDGESETLPIFSCHHIVPDVLFYMDDAYSIMAMVEKGIAISIIPETSVCRNPYHICSKELSVPAHRNIYIVYRRSPRLSRAAQTFLDDFLYPSLHS